MIIGLPVLNRPDLLRECVASIDYPCKLVLIDNSHEGGMGEVAESVLPEGVELWVVEPPSNLGFTASVNFTIRTSPKEPYWVIANVDTVFGKGDLARLAEAMSDPEPRWVGIVDWRVFALNRACVERVGLWDESFYNYCSDADYEYRCSLAGVPMIRLPGETSHVGSVCYQGDPRNAAHNARSYPIERAYYRDKWGGELRGGERFSTPFDRGGELGDWRLDIARLAEEAWD